MKKLSAKKTPALRALACVLVGCIVLGGAGFGLYYFFRPKPQPGTELVKAPTAGLNMQSTISDSNKCIATDSAFLLTLTEPLDKKDIKQWLKITPEFEYDLVKTKKALEYELVPSAALKKNAVYNFSFDPLQTSNGLPEREENTWAFQTQSGFAVERNFPEDQGEKVPVNTVTEIKFSGDVKLAELKKNVVIEPQLKGGDWKKTGVNTYSFLPDEEMKEATVYNVKIKAALTDASGKQKLGEDYIFKFLTTKYQSDVKDLFLYNVNNAYRPSEKPMFSLSAPEQTTKVQAKVFKFGAMGDYAKAVTDVLNYNFWDGKPEPKVDTAKLEKVFEGTIESLAGRIDRYLSLPEALPKGQYIIEISVGGQTATSLFQVTELSAYAMSGGDDYLFWVNDLASKQPVEGAEILKAGTIVSKTNKQGVATVKTKVEEDRSAFYVKHGEDRLFLLISNAVSTPDDFNEMDYWRYFYIDKVLYQPGDTMNFFGVVSPKLQGVKQVDKVTISVSNDWYDSNSEIKVDAEVKNGVFEGKMNLDGLNGSWYSVQVMIGDESIESAYFELKPYEKPSCHIVPQASASIVWAGDKINVNATAEYFDGTPVANLDVLIDGKKLTTDKNGRVSRSVNTTIDKTTLYDYRYIGIEAVLPEIGETYDYFDCQSVNSDVEVKAMVKKSGDTYNLELQAFNVDFKGLDRLEYSNEDEYLKDFSGALPLTVKWNRIVYTKTPNGEKYYNPYTKTYDIGYSYDEKKVPEGSKTITLNGKDKQSFELPLKDGEGYNIVIEGKDKAGRSFTREENAFLTYWNYYDYDNLTVYDNKDKTDYEIGDEVSLSLYLDGDASERQPAKGTALFMRASDHLVDYNVSENNLYAFKFDGKILPNIVIVGVLFDGRKYTVTNQFYSDSCNLNTESRDLKLTVTPDKTKYNPGDTAKLSLSLTDKDDKPVKGFVNLNILDEALLSVQEQYSDINSSLFSSFYYFNFNSLISHEIVRRLADDGGAGEGDGDRTDFRDSALFKTLETNAGGKADVEVRLPDNITSWRVIWQAFSPTDVRAGSGKAAILVTQPFFADVRLGSTFLVGDQPNIGLRNAGVALDGGNVDYTVEIPALKFTKSVSGPVSEWYDVQLPKLAKGSYSISVTAKYKEYSDKITKKFNVVDSVATHTEAKSYALTNATKFDLPVKNTARLLFSDVKNKLVVGGLYDIMNTGSVRVEQLLASRIASETLQDVLEKPVRTAEEKQALAQYQQGDGSVQPFTYGDVDLSETLETTAWACAAGSEYFDKERAATYLSEQFDEAQRNKSDNVVALFGLAALKKPVLQYVNDCASRSNELTTEQRILVALAQIYIGDGKAAKPAVQEIIKTQCKAAGETMFVDQQGRENVIKQTANLAVAAVLLDLPEGKQLLQYVTENRGYDNLYLLQQAIALRHMAQKVSLDNASLTYTLGKETKKLELFTTRSVLLTAAQLKEIRFSEVTKDIEVTVIYSAAGFPQDKDAKLKVAQEYNSKYKAADGKIIGKLNFEIAADAPDGCYSIVHVLPAGLSFVEMAVDEDQNLWVTDVNGQQVTFTIYKEKAAIKKRLSFQARAVMTGSFGSEGSYIVNSNKPEIANSTNGSTITIQ